MQSNLSLINSKKLTYIFPNMDGETKLRELILYIADQSIEDRYFGAIKLNKILYFSDFESFRIYGKPITGVEYQRLPQGPAPKKLLPIRSKMEENVEIKLKEIETVSGTQKRVIALRNPDLSLFSAEEIDIVNQVIRFLWNANAREASDFTHGISWRAYNDYDSMPYESALINNKISDDDIERANELADKYGWR